MEEIGKLFYNPTKDLIIEPPMEDFINNDKSIIRCEKLSYVGSGSNSSIWKYEIDEEFYAFKTFFEDRYSYSLKYETYLRMRDLPLKNVVKALDVYYKLSKSDDVINIDAYITKYLQKSDDMTLIECSVDSLLENISNLEDDVKMLSDNHIFMLDVRIDNSIIDSDDSKFYVTDVDMFRVDDTYTTAQILKYNRLRLGILIKDQLKYGLRRSLDISNSKEKSLSSLLNGYFSVPDIENKPLDIIIEDLFSGYETPKRYFLKR